MSAGLYGEGTTEHNNYFVTVAGWQLELLVSCVQSQYGSTQLQRQCDRNAIDASRATLPGLTGKLDRMRDRLPGGRRHHDRHAMLERGRS